LLSAIKSVGQANNSTISSLDWATGGRDRVSSTCQVIHVCLSQQGK